VRRWNGWGDASIESTVPSGALEYLRNSIGTGHIPSDASFDDIVATAPPSRLPEHPLVDREPAIRLLHARGQSLPDWLALRFGRVDRIPDAVAFPESSGDVRELLAFASAQGARVVPYGGGTSVAGHITPPGGDAPVLTIATARMRRLIELDTVANLATFAAGVIGPDLEAQLRAHGYTLGHFPQSFEYSSLGGWVVTRSSGQQSMHYGRIEALFAGARVETPRGTMTVPTFPASAAGTDLREIVLGSEGRIGIVTEATVRVRRVPQAETFTGWFFPDWPRAQTAVRAMAQADIGLSMLRLSNENETLTTLRLAGGSRLAALLEWYLSLRGARDGERCMLIAGATGSADAVRAAQLDVATIARQHGGIGVGTRLGQRWKHQRFRGVYLRNALWNAGYAVDTVETAVDWSRVQPAMRAMEAAAKGSFGDEAIHAYTHLSHLYPQGSSIYSTFIFRLVPEYEENLHRWQRLKHAVSEAIVANGATISHQHGVGTDHRPYLAAEKGPLGIEAMQAVFARLDPDAIMNPEKLVE
jgi:alkyldihydroxyacetonephosphate synthase